MAEVRYKGRIGVLAGLLVLVFLGISVRLCLVQLRPDEWIIKPIQEQRTLEEKPVGRRGQIVDCNGEILAIDRTAYHVTLDPKYIHESGDAEAVIHYLSEEFSIPEETMREYLSDTRRQWVAIKKYVPEHRLKRFERRAFGAVYTPRDPLPDGSTNIYLRGVKMEETSIRHYPKGALMAHVVGFSNLEGVGSAGIEQRFDEFLRGKEGLRISTTDGRRREIYNRRRVDIPPEDGATVMLTLDQQLQYVVEKAVERTCHEFNAKGVWAIVQRVRTGEILAMASFPTYDLNRYSHAPPEWMRNNAISYNYEPGSVMKAALISSALERNVVQTNDMIDVEGGYWRYGGAKLEDTHEYEELDVADVVKYSSNIGTAKIAMMMGNEATYDSMKAFHFGSPLGVGLPGEEGGILNRVSRWSKISITRIGMGQEVSATALQMLSMLDAIALNGVQMKPYVVKKVVAADGSIILENKPEELGRPLSPRAAKQMRKLLMRVTEDGGTGVKAQVEGYSVAGKTGTAQKIRPKEEGGGYYGQRFWSSFGGFLPAEDPEIGIIVVADDPVKTYENGRIRGLHGGTVCGPAFQEIAEFAVRYLRIAPDGERIYVVRPNE
ncbi:MAG: penicillin-binding protein 2 [Pontiellaceae bacterium]|nr:penicillin-binding protein 2 [Pontiellaceae bacterium]MBN2785210.1 penicillin-binding protein 2 [Pontiellaceae bacterium]